MAGRQAVAAACPAWLRHAHSDVVGAFGFGRGGRSAGVSRRVSKAWPLALLTAVLSACGDEHDGARDGGASSDTPTDCTWSDDYGLDLESGQYTGDCEALVLMGSVRQLKSSCLVEQDYVSPPPLCSRHLVVVCPLEHEEKLRVDVTAAGKIGTWTASVRVEVTRPPVYVDPETGISVSGSSKVCTGAFYNVPVSKQPGEADLSGASFDSIYQTLMPSCVPCHSENGAYKQLAIDFTSKETAYATLVGKMAVVTGNGGQCGGRTLVKPSECAKSLLWQKLKYATGSPQLCGAGMPFGAAMLRDEIVEGICDWITLHPLSALQNWPRSKWIDIVTRGARTLKFDSSCWLLDHSAFWIGKGGARRFSWLASLCPVAGARAGRSFRGRLE
jgi:hypothetical protein